MIMSLKQNKFNPKISVLTELDLEIKNKEKKSRKQTKGKIESRYMSHLLNRLVSCYDDLIFGLEKPDGVTVLNLYSVSQEN